MSTSRTQETRGWPEVIADNAAEVGSAARLIGQLRACEAAALAFCRLLERWSRGDAHPPTPGGREAALRRAADRIETALVGLEAPLARYLLELEPSFAEGGTWYSQPSSAELLDWTPVTASPPSTWSSRSSCGRSKGLQTQPGSDPRPTARRSGPGSSTCGRTCSAARSRTCARSPPEPVALRRETRPEERHHVLRVRIAAEHRLLEHEIAVDVDVENAACPRHHLDGADALLELLENVRCQTDSVRQCASGDAVFDPNQAAVGHHAMLSGAMAPR